ncbi:hypothetical protein OPFLODJI_03569 [Aeromonas hydrophila]|uniref:restriction endonuclease subunit S n=1 Tax=Aeromonas hydrophila TaxID=644 RepID=UPI003672DA54
MKAGWRLIELHNICLFENGDRGENYPSKSAQTTSGIPFINAGHLTDDGIDFSSMNYISKERFNLLGNGKIQPNDFLFCLRGSLGKFACVDNLTEGAIASSLVIVRPTEQVLRGFLSAYFQSDICVNMIEKYKNGAAQPNLSAGNLKKFLIPLPPLPEQQRIVAILDEAFEAIAAARANAEQNRQNARALFESYLQSVFSQRGDEWVEKSLEELGTITSSKRIFKSEYVSAGIPFYRTKEIKELANGRTISTELFIAEERYKDIKSNFGVPKKGDILLTAIGTIGEVWVVDGSGDFYFKDGNVLWFKNFTSILPTFLKYVLESFVDSLNKMSHGSAYNALPIQRLKTHKICLPSMIEQEQIVKSLVTLRNETQHLESLYQRKIAALDELKQSLLQQAFSGQL